MAGICTGWLALDEATPANGSKGAIPGTRVHGFSEYVEVTDLAGSIFDSQIDPASIG